MFRSWREGLGLGVEQAAVALGMHRTTVFRIEAMREPIEWTLELACRYLLAIARMGSVDREDFAGEPLLRWARDAKII